MLNKTIRLFLDSIGRRDEYEFYLNKFQSEHSACFALLCPDYGSIEAGAEVLAFDLHFLQRLELVPAILLCGDEVEKMQSALAVEPVFVFQYLDGGDPADFIRQSHASEKVPVLVSRNNDLEAVLLGLLPGVAKRVHFIRAGGGLKNSSGDIIPYFYTHKEKRQHLEELSFDYPALAKVLLEERSGVHVSITSPINLLKELFTIKGDGTLFRKGITVDFHQGLEGVDRERLLALLEASFGKKLISEAFLTTVTHAYIERNYRGAVLLDEHPAGLYLSKFAVGQQARGEGVAMELWREIHSNHSALFWRSNASNSFNSWYQKQADGHHRSGKWQIFWRGIPAATISGIIEYCTSKKEDFATQ